MDRMDAVDWLGNFLSCRDCPHGEIREKGLCDLGQVCVRDRRARRIDRFFAASPQEAAKYLDHPYFELRVGAVKYASVFQLRALIDDEEPDVRAMVAQRLPLRLAERMIGDRDRKVRMALAQRVEGASLVKANAFRASLAGAKLGGADFRGANLFQAEFLDASTEGAAFEEADLTGTKLA